MPNASHTPDPTAAVETSPPASAPSPSPTTTTETAAAEKTEGAPAGETPAGDQPAKSESASSTNELLALAGGPAPAAAPTAADKPADTATSPGASGSMAAAYGAASKNNATNMTPPMTPPMNLNNGSQSNSPNLAMMPQSPQGNNMIPPAEGAMQNGGANPNPNPMPGVMPANMNDPGMDGKPDGPGGTFRNPMTAAAAFLKALQAKDPDRLAQTTALRAPTEASPKYQKMFTAILEQSLAPEDLDELAKKFEGYQIYGSNQARSTGKFEVIVSRAQGTSQFHRTITLRKEKLGWKVLDISGAREFEKPIVLVKPRGMGGNTGARHR